PLLGEDADGRSAALLIQAREMCGIGDAGEITARRACALDLGDDLDLRGPLQRGQRIERRRTVERRALDLSERTPLRPELRILYRAGREVGEHAQWPLAWY